MIESNVEIEYEIGCSGREGRSNWNEGLALPSPPLPILLIPHLVPSIAILTSCHIICYPNRVCKDNSAMIHLLDFAVLVQELKRRERESLK